MADTDRLIAPELIFVETPSALHRLVRGEVIEDRRAEEAVHDLCAGHRPLLTTDARPARASTTGVTLTLVR